MNEQQYFNTFNDSEYRDSEQLAVLQQSPDAAIERLRMDYHDRRQKAWEMGASYLDYKSWLEEHVIRQQDFTANVQDDYESWKARAEKAEADYAKLCNAVVGANCHVDHAIETLDEERKQKWLTLQSLAAEESDKILYRNQRDDLAYELNQTISYLITLEQGNPLRPIADTVAHLVAVLRNMNTAIDELNATLLEGGE